MSDIIKTSSEREAQIRKSNASIGYVLDFGSQLATAFRNRFEQTDSKLKDLEAQQPGAITKLLLINQAENISNEIQRYYSEFDTKPELHKGTHSTITKGICK
jgi:hypothetical protein